MITGLKKWSVEGKLVTKNKTQYFGRELYTRCIYSKPEGEETKTYGMYDIPSIINTLHQNIYNLGCENTEAQQEKVDTQ